MMKRSQQHSLLAIGMVAAFIAAVRCTPIEVADIEERLYPQALSDRIEQERREHCTPIEVADIEERLYPQALSDRIEQERREHCTRQPIPSEPDMYDPGRSPGCL